MLTISTKKAGKLKRGDSKILNRINHKRVSEVLKSREDIPKIVVTPPGPKSGS